MYRSARAPPPGGNEIELHLHGDQDLLGDDVFDLRAYRDDARALEKSAAFGGGMRSYSDHAEDGGVGEVDAKGGGGGGGGGHGTADVGDGRGGGSGGGGGGSGGGSDNLPASRSPQHRYSIGGDSVMAHEDEFL